VGRIEYLTLPAVGSSEIFSTVGHPSDYPQDANQVDVLDKRGLSPAESLRRIRSAANRYRVVVLDGSAPSEQVAAALIARMRRPPRVIMTDATWKRGSSLSDRLLCGVGMRAMQGPHVTFCVLSSWELELFPKTWGIPAAQVSFTPFCFTIAKQELDLPLADDGGVFAGGDSLRDYKPLLNAAHEIDAKVTIASRRLDGRPGLPANVSVGEVSPQRFAELNRRAAVVVVALADSSDRSAGQQSYLNAMALGKPVVVTDAPGVRDYVEDRRTGLIVPLADPSAMSSALRWLLDPQNREEVNRIGRRARDTVRSRFTWRNYIASIIGVVEEVQRSAPIDAKGGASQPQGEQVAGLSPPHGDQNG